MARTIIGIVILVATTTWIMAQQPSTEPRVIGVWRAVESIDDSQPVVLRRTHQPAIYIFTSRHYSIQSISGADPRPDVPAPQAGTLTDADKIARYEHWSRFTAHSGTYDRRGTQLTTTPIVAKNNRVMTPLGVEHWQVTVDGDTIWLANIGAKYRVKLIRLE
jgi:hypothetical protein